MKARFAHGFAAVSKNDLRKLLNEKYAENTKNARKLALLPLP